MDGGCPCPFLGVTEVRACPCVRCPRQRLLLLWLRAFIVKPPHRPGSAALHVFAAVGAVLLPRAVTCWALAALWSSHCGSGSQLSLLLLVEKCTQSGGAVQDGGVTAPPVGSAGHAEHVGAVTAVCPPVRLCPGAPAVLCPLVHF